MTIRLVDGGGADPERLLFAFLDALPDGAFIKDEKMRLIHANEAYCRLVGRPFEELIGRDELDFLPAELREQCRDSDRRTLESGEKIVATETMGDRVFETIKFVFKPAPGRHRLCGICREVTERERITAELQRRDMNRLALIDLPGIQFCRWLPDTTLINVNHEYAVAYGSTVEELTGRRWLELVPESERAAVRAVIDDLVARPRTRSYEHEVEGAAGPRRVTWTDWPCRDEQGRLEAFQSVGIDTTELTDARDRLANQRAMLDALLDATTDAIYIKDREGRYLYFNAATERITGRTRAEALGRDDTFLFSPKEARATAETDRRALAADVSIAFDEEIVAVSGQKACLHTVKGPIRNAAGETIGLFGIARDVTERKRFDESFQRLQRFESLGRLAGGIAHDFNNLLTVITQCAEMLVAGRSADDKESLSEIVRTARRGAVLVRRLLAFGRRQTIERRRLEPKSLLEEMKTIFDRLLGEDLVLRLDLAPNLPPILGDAGQLEQVALNLALNARDAMPRGGVLTIAAREVVRAEEPLGRGYAIAAGRYLELRFADTGPGIPDDAKAIVFEPSYTTKEVGKGSGLGLATCYGIVKQHGGYIYCEDAPGGGACFVVLLPGGAEAEPAGAEAPVVFSAPQPSAPELASRRILVVEDEDGIRRVVRRALESNGCLVHAAANGREALALVERGLEFDLLLTDVVMPEMSGMELKRRLLERVPNLRVIFMTGYIEEYVAMAEIGLPQTTLLRKPFTVSDLVAAIQHCLAEVD